MHPADHVLRANASETTRVETFSDAVFAISMTLLGLALKVPRPEAHESLLLALGREWPAFLAVVTSFVTISIVWINHHRLFTHIHRVSHGLMLVNGLLLMTVSLTPFTTDLVATYIGHDGAKTAAAIYAASQVLVTGSFNLLWRHATRHRRLLDHHVAPSTIRRINLQYGFGPLLYVAAIMVAALSALASIILDVAFAVFFALPAFTISDAVPAQPHDASADEDAGFASG